jgi:hypothetical protein
MIATPSKPVYFTGSADDFYLGAMAKIGHDRRAAGQPERSFNTFGSPGHSVTIMVTSEADQVELRNALTELEFGFEETTEDPYHGTVRAFHPSQEA